MTKIKINKGAKKAVTIKGYNLISGKWYTIEETHTVAYYYTGCVLIRFANKYHIEIAIHYNDFDFLEIPPPKQITLDFL